MNTTFVPHFCLKILILETHQIFYSYTDTFISTPKHHSGFKNTTVKLLIGFVISSRLVQSTKFELIPGCFCNDNSNMISEIKCQCKIRSV